MKITKIKAAGLRGGTPEGGWANEIKPQDCVHTLVAVLTDEGITGWGSVFATDELVEAALHLLEPLYLGENPQEPERVSEKLHANTFWMGRGGTVTHAISGIDIALWDILGKTTGQPVGRLLGGCYRSRVLPYASVLMREPRALADHLLAIREEGFRAFKIGWGPFGWQSNAMDEQIVRAAREAVGPESLLMVDAGASNAFWPQSFKWAVRTARMLADFGVYWFEEPLLPDNLSDYTLSRSTPGKDSPDHRDLWLPHNSPVSILLSRAKSRRSSVGVPTLTGRSLPLRPPSASLYFAKLLSEKHLPNDLR